MQFVRLADEAVDLLTGGQAERALRRTDEALALWRGRPFIPVSDEPWAPSVARLEELHAQVRGASDRGAAGRGRPGAGACGARNRRSPPSRCASGCGLTACSPRTAAGAPTRRWRPTAAPWPSCCSTRSGSSPARTSASCTAGSWRRIPASSGLSGRTTAAVGRGADPAVEIHLPVRHTRPIGRDGERDRIAALLAGHPLVTIVGTAGCGKTQLSIEAARMAAGEFPDGVWAVDLTAAQGGDQVLPTIASAVGLAVPTAGTSAEALRRSPAGGGCCCCSTTVSTSSTTPPNSSTPCSSTAASSPCCA